MVEQPRVKGVFERARHAVISTLLNHYEGKGGYAPQRKIDFNHFILHLAKDTDFKAYAQTLMTRPETRFHADQIAVALNQDVHLPGSGPFLLSRITRDLGRARIAAEKILHLERGIPAEELLDEPPSDEERFPKPLWLAALSQAADAILSGLHHDAALKRTVQVRKKRSGSKPYLYHESLIHLTRQHVDRLRQLASDSQTHSD